MKENTMSTPHSRFPTQGTIASAVNTSGHPTTQAVKRYAGGSGMLQAATAAHRANVPEDLGASGGIKVQSEGRNAAEANLTERNVHILPPAKRRVSFYDAEASATY